MAVLTHTADASLGKIMIFPEDFMAVSLLSPLYHAQTNWCRFLPENPVMEGFSFLLLFRLWWPLLPLINLEVLMEKSRLVQSWNMT